MKVDFPSSNAVDGVPVESEGLVVKGSNCRRPTRPVSTETGRDDVCTLKKVKEGVYTRTASSSFAKRDKM